MATTTVTMPLSQGQLATIAGLFVAQQVLNFQGYSFPRAVVGAALVQVVGRAILKHFGSADLRFARVLLLWVTSLFYVYETFLFDSAVAKSDEMETVLDVTIMYGRGLYTMPLTIGLSLYILIMG